MRLLLSLCLFCILSKTSGESPPSCIQGRVYDKENREALAGANIIYGNNQGTVSNNEGFYSILLDPGKWKITFQYVGYISEAKTVNLAAGDTIHLDAGLVPALNEIDQIVISAGRAEQKISDLTVSMTLIKPHFLTNNHITDPQELINKTPGIEVLDGQASIRGGSGFSYGAGSRVMALVDGLPVLSADAGNIKWQFLPLENLSQIEIIKGASSVLYGSSALNGVLNFRTADAGIEPKTKFVTETGIFGKPAREEWMWWSTPRLYANTSLSHIQKTGNTDVAFSGRMLTDNGYRKLNDEKMGRFGLRLKHDSEKVEGLDYGVNLNGGLTRKTDFVLWEDAINGALKQNETTATRLNGTFFALDPFLSFEPGKGTRHDLKMRIQNTSNKFPDGAQTNSDAVSLYTEYQFQKTVSKFFKLNLGLAENYSKVFSNLYGDHNLMNIAGFSQLDIETNKKLKIVAGVRLEQNFPDGKPDKLIPIFRTGINYNLGRYTFFRASFGQGYRYPSIAEKYASTCLGSIKIFPNHEVLPESGWNSEVGIKQGIAIGEMSGMIDVAAFYSQNRQMIEYVFGLYPDPLSEEFAFGFRAANIERSRVYGAELEFTLNFATGPINQNLTGGYLWLHPVEYTNIDKYLKYRRKHSASLGWNTRIGNFDMGLNIYVKSRILEIDNVFVNEFTREDILPGFYEYWMANNQGYLLSDFTLGYRISERIKISLAVKNLFNKEYMGRPGDIMPHRNFSIRISGVF